MNLKICTMASVALFAGLLFNLSAFNGGEVEITQAKIRDDIHSKGETVDMKNSARKTGKSVVKPDDSQIQSFAVADAGSGNAAWNEIQARKITNKAQLDEAVMKQVNLFAGKKDMAAIKKLLAEAEKDTNLTDESKFKFALIALGADSVLAGKELKPTAIPKTEIGAEKQAPLFNAAAKVFMISRNYDVAQLLAGKIVHPEVPRYTVEFMEKAPVGVAAWEASDIVKKKEKREARFEQYNKKAAATLFTDVNVVRNVITAADDAKAGIAFYMAADPYGIHIYIQYDEERPDDVLAGLAPGAMFEMYLQPGPGECYYQWMNDLDSDKTSFVPWMSPNKTYRKMDSYYKKEIEKISTGFGIYMFISWQLVYDKLPVAQSEWPLGIIPWGPRGGFTWGSGQVHELNKFGRVKFANIDKFMPQVKRLIVINAFGKFKKDYQNLELFWKDEVKGDPGFYNSMLKPEIERLLKAGEGVTAAMPLDKAQALFDTVVADWMEFEFIVADLRAEYLKKKLLSE